MRISTQPKGILNHERTNWLVKLPARFSKIMEDICKKSHINIHSNKGKHGFTYISVAMNPVSSDRKRNSMKRQQQTETGKEES